MNESVDRKALLDNLKIDREAPASGDGGRPLKWFALIAVIGGAVFALWFFDLPTQNQAVPVKTAMARAGAAQTAGASVLDATGYVVARRQATVSSKATGKVVEVLIEEGVEVAQGQLLARLDDSIPRAQLELAQSQIRSAEAVIAELEVALKQAQLDFDRTQGLAARNLASQADLDRDELSVQAIFARLDRARKDIEVAQASMAVQRQALEDLPDERHVGKRQHGERAAEPALPPAEQHGHGEVPRHGEREAEQRVGQGLPGEGAVEQSAQVDPPGEAAPEQQGSDVDDRPEQRLAERVPAVGSDHEHGDF